MIELLRRLRVCKPGTDCTNCPMRYEEECDGDPFLVRVRCAALDAADELDTLFTKLRKTKKILKIINELLDKSIE